MPNLCFLCRPILGTGRRFIPGLRISVINVPLGLLALWLTERHAPEGPRNRSRSLDPLGQLLAVEILATATSRCSLGVDSNLEAVGVTPLQSDVLPSEELAGNAAPIVGAYAVIP